LQQSKASIAIVPIENSITSSIHANVDMLFEGNFTITNEIFLQINLGLFAQTGLQLTDITEVYSHPQALAQAAKVTKLHGWSTHETSSTSAALNQIIKSKSAAALLPISTNVSGIECLLKEVQDTEENQTRFITVANNPLNLEQGTKASLLIEITHEVGSLEKLLADFAKHKINLSKIESRPIPGKNWSYRFWIDVTLPEPARFEELNKQLSEYSSIETFKIIGIYTPGKVI
jgi:prephenate dehydratase